MTEQVHETTARRAIALINELDESHRHAESAKRREQHASATAPAKKRAVEREIAYLRTKIEELQARRDHLHTEYLKRTAAVRVWEQVATRQEKRRLDVELENCKLRVILDTQLQVGRDLLSLLERKAPHLLPPAPLFQLSFSGKESLSNVEQMAVLEQLYHHSRDVFADDEPLAMDSSLSAREMNVSMVDDGAMAIEITMEWVLPFPIDRVVDVVWYATKLAAAKRGRMTEENDVVSVDYEAAKVGVGAISGRYLATKYAAWSDLPATIVSHSTCMVEKRPKDEKTSVPVEYVEDTWLRITESLVSGTSMTRVQIRQHMHSVLVMDKPSKQQHFAGKLTDLVIACVDLDLTWRQECIENLLFVNSE
ncbi:hypothetical protein Poli38472_007246 [Pythium oligandrum]|uniref:Uncharacterized protein n=1 Tax=Pythium oligandrum TaxID=41045 RepID=A0A8K1FE68_PYTOL|nr:hypothetical protein Poli38472_007246 [Pythium oligandrum]|eukprot:TMW59101.1 hypothetical protein Poli38472_007246 [Pythium oligandrum]